uniref:substrate-binding domain-containing protein n=1 Tax=Flavobacterium sp. TaxID=239 RepID=UPI00404AB8A3
MKKIRIAGVPEHFNLPWHLCIENGEFEVEGIELEWTDVPEGTGKMCELLRKNETDLAIILTEGIIKDISQGNPSKIVQKYIQSPLIWGIHVAGNSEITAVSELKNTKAAISRLGSGSHLMAAVLAKENNWTLTPDDFQIVHTIDGAVEALTNDDATYFLWERFTTQPIVDQGIFKRIGDFLTPWPCFVIAATDEILAKHPQTIQRILEIINQTTAEFKHIPSIDKTLSIRYDQKLDAIQKWLSRTQWSQENLSEETLNKIQNQLLEVEIINKKDTFASLVHTL